MASKMHVNTYFMTFYNTQQHIDWTPHNPKVGGSSSPSATNQNLVNACIYEIFSF